MPLEGNYTITVGEEFREPLKKRAAEHDRDVKHEVQAILREAGVVPEQKVAQVAGKRSK